MNGWYTQGEAAAELGVDRTTLIRWHSELGCPKPTRRRRTGRGHPLIYTQADIDAIREWADGAEERDG